MPVLHRGHGVELELPWLRPLRARLFQQSVGQQDTILQRLSGGDVQPVLRTGFLRCLPCGDLQSSDWSNVVVIMHRLSCGHVQSNIWQHIVVRLHRLPVWNVQSVLWRRLSHLMQCLSSGQLQSVEWQLVAIVVLGLSYGDV
jgi:DNA-directed RNA polymerase subunit N (RpoN/RPB10)